MFRLTKKGNVPQSSSNLKNTVSAGLESDFTTQTAEEPHSLVQQTIDGEI
jgi:hypothetical protein